jgi:hypothetical protein
MSEVQTQGTGDLTTAYGELCTTYNSIRDFRGKLLALLPLASGGGIFFLIDQVPSPLLIPVGLIGAFVTIGLWLYELHNMQRCHDLIKRGQEWEKVLTNNRGGQFTDHPYVRLPNKGSLVVKAATCVYGAVFIGWLFIVALGCYYLF